MRIALTHNLKITGSAEEAEFDSPETIDALAGALERAGHEVERIEVSGPASRVLARLEALQPDLIFNTAEGHKGKAREAFYPSLFDELGIPYTGSDAYALNIALDKSLTKRLLASYGVATPRARFVNRTTLESGALDDVSFPVIVKPNFEGSSKGISREWSVCEDAYELAAVVERQLARFEAGLLVEHYIAGVDVACAFVDGLRVGGGGREGGGGVPEGVLDPVEFVIDPRVPGSYNVYDFNLKHARPEFVTLRPAQLPAPTLDRIRSLTARVVRALGLRDHARCEFRVTPSTRNPGHDVHFLEVDGLPTLKPGASVFVAAAQRGVDFDGVIRAIVRSACKRRGLLPLLEGGQPRRAKRGALRVGFTFNMKRGEPAAAEGGSPGKAGAAGAHDSEAEFDSPRTIQAIASAIESYGHTVVPLEATPDLPRALTAAGVDVVFNIAEGLRGRGREAQVPALCELLGIPYSGSDATTLSLALDKGLTKQILRAAGIDTAEWQVVTTGREKLKAFRYPVIVKPNAEGTSKGITSASVVKDEAGARAAAKLLVERYHQPALIEEYIAGREFTVGLLGERRPKVLPPMEVVFVDPPTYPVYGYEEKQSDTPRVRFECPAQLTTSELRRIEKVARDTFAALACRDVARVDLRMAKDGRVYVIEINPLPGLTPDFSDLCQIAKVAGMDYRTLIGEILAGCLKRHREARATAPQGALAAARGAGAAPTQVAAGPTQVAAGPTQVAASPTQVAASPTQVAASPTQVAASPTQVAASPTQVAASPTQVAASPTQVAADPTQVAASPTQVAADPTQVAASPTQVAAAASPTQVAAAGSAAERVPRSIVGEEVNGP
ncbi:D-alanine--D-alanine ligase [Sorangium cellulosum]|uniref:D-alanine--D-alanine ligase n=1 Tax=Sorangium cellulosum TaxID=56 RepID=A0A4P2PUZ3_SORCE|nr:ATP-grasp domain-containing protein [Sorangium cellulosum]AUX20430.1 D-alanine--D-alanine ligase [Sorangium cellulosum]